jgi:hypothetical protein
MSRAGGTEAHLPTGSGVHSAIALERPAMTTKTSVSCVVSLGFFSSEYYIRLSSGDAYIVDRNNVTVEREPQSRTEEVNGKVVAYVVDQNATVLLVELPGNPVAGGLRSWVPKNDADPLAHAA